MSHQHHHHHHHHQQHQQQYQRKQQQQQQQQHPFHIYAQPQTQHQQQPPHQQWYAHINDIQPQQQQQQQQQHQQYIAGHVRDSRHLHAPHIYGSMLGHSSGAYMAGASMQSMGRHAYNMPGTTATSVPYTFPHNPIRGDNNIVHTRNYDLEMVNRAHSIPSTTHTMIGGDNHRSYDAYSHNAAIFTQQQQQQQQHQQQQQQQQVRLHHHHAVHPIHHQSHQQQHSIPGHQATHHHHHHQQQQQQQQQQRHQQHIQQQLVPNPMHNMKTKPVEEITITPTIQMDEIIIKAEPPDEYIYHRNLQQQHQQQQQQPSYSVLKCIKQEPQAQPQLLQQQQQQQQHHHQQQQQRQQQHQLAQQRQSKQLQSPPPPQPPPPPPPQAPPAATVTSIATTPPPEASSPIDEKDIKPMNFPRRKVQTERSSTLPICHRCKQVFLKRQNYTQHVALSTCDMVEYDFRCSICPMSYMSNEELRAHERLHRLYRYFCMLNCGKHFETIQECEHHEYMEHDQYMYKCGMCGLDYPTREELLIHRKCHKYATRFVCTICRGWFRNMSRLHNHYLNNPYRCGKFYNKDDFNACATETSIKFRKVSTDTNGEHDSKQSTDDLNASDDIVEEMDTAPPDESSSDEEVETEIKVEPDFYPPMDQTDYQSEEFSTNQNLNFLHDFQENASNSTNSSYTMGGSEAIAGDQDVVCCVKFCGVTKHASPSLQFFNFPREDKYLQQWLHNLKMPYDPQVKYTQYRICSLHFPKRCINRYSLSYWAVPTFNLGHDEVANLYQNREISNSLLSSDAARCCMPGCRAQRGQTNVKFYNFPKDLKTLIKWCQNARLPVHTKESRHFCSRHFEEKCFGKFRLKPWAIPTLNLGTVYGKIHDNPNVSYLEEKKCCLTFCRKSRSDDFSLSLYRFPRDESMLRKWCYNLRLHPDVYRGKNHKICSHHFIKEALGLRKLSPGAVPTLNLGHNDRINIYDNELHPPSNVASTSYSAKAAAASALTASIRKAQLLKYRNASQSANASASSIYDEVLSNSQKFSSSSSSVASNAIELGDVCLVPSCKRSRHTENVTLHTVPRRPEQLEKWCHNLKMNLNGLHKNARICSAHFENYCIGGCMRPFAVPTLELGHEDSDIYRNPDVIKKLNIRETCCVPSCKRNRDRDHANLHRFPTNPDLLQKWCANLQKSIPDGTKLFNDAVCEVHFEDKCLRNKRLEKWAVPTLKLGYEPIPHYLPSQEEIDEYWSKPMAPNNGDETGECCVVTCKRNPQMDDVKLYRPPEDAEQLVKWSHNLQIDVTKLSTMKICNLHFETHCIGKRLLNWAMPTLNLAAKVEHLFENPPPTISHYRRRVKLGLKAEHDLIKWSPRCCLAHCRKMRSRDNVQLYRFPVNLNTMSKWCHNVQLPVVGSSHRRICSAHFESSVLTKRCPIATAVPTVNLNTPPGYKIYQNSPKLKQHKIFSQRWCVVSTCRKTRSEGVQLFRFPHNRIILTKWRYNLKNLPKGKLSSQFRICSLHFENHSIGMKRLSPGAIPTLNLGHEAEDIYPNETRSFFDLDKCVVNGCSSSKETENIRLFKFPGDDEELLGKWCHNLKMNPNDCIGIKICSLHFETDCMGPRLLYKWSIPTLQLGYENAEDAPEIIPNPPIEKRCGEVLFKCCLPSCGKTRKYDEAQMNSFPKNVKMFRRWQHNLKLDFLDFKDREKYKICNDHFEAICLGKTRLNFGAIPTINLGHNLTNDLYKVNPQKIWPNLFTKQSEYEKELYEGENKRTDGEYSRLEGEVGEEEEVVVETSNIPMNFTCLFNECNGPKSLMREPYDIPQTEQLKTLWCTLMKVEPNSISGDNKLCGLHFQQLFNETREQMLALSTEDTDMKRDFEKLDYAYKKSEISLVIKGSKCSIQDCYKTLVEPHVKLYQFPYGKELIEKWSHNTNIKPDEHRRYLTKICCLHFEAYCFTPNQRLRTWAIPTLNLTNAPTKTIHKNPDLTTLDRRLVGPPILKCCVPNCTQENNETIEGNKLFSFPMDDNILQKWCENLKLSREQTPIFKICAQHFEKQCFGLSRLRSGAIPTAKLGHNEEPIHHNQSSLKEEMYEPKVDQNVGLGLKQAKIKKSLDSMKCFIPSCRRSRLQHGVRFFTFPSNPVLRHKWCHNLQMPANFGKLLSIRICSIHFHKKCLEGKNLKDWAVPTLHLGHNESIYDNPRAMRRHNIPKCILPHCGEQRSHGKELRFFTFPKDNQILKKWCKNLKLSGEQCKGRHLCEKHFEAKVLSYKRLKTSCVPTLNLGHSEPLVYNNVALLEDRQHSLTDANANEAEDIDSLELDLEEAEGNDFETESLRTPISWSNLESRELRVKITPLKHEDLTDIASICSSMSKEKEENDSIYSGCESREDTATLSANRKSKTVNSFNAICCLKHCRKEKTPEQHLTTYGFPKDLELLRKWCDNLGLELNQCIGRVCVDHFELRVMGRRRLKPGAVPTLNLGHDRPLKHTNDAIKLKMNEKSKTSEQTEDKFSSPEPKLTPPPYKTRPTKQSVFRLCCLKHCRRKKDLDTSNKEVPIVFKFPQEPKLLKKWSEALHIPLQQCTRPNLGLCADHFETHCFENEAKYQLKANSVPTINLKEDFQKKEEICCLKHCASSTKCHDNVFLLSFPLKPQVLIRKWCYNTRISHKVKGLKSLKICSLHFEKQVFFRGCLLRINAVPTINLGHTGKIYKNPKSYRIINVQKPLEKCCIVSCQQESDKLYSFPKNSELRRIWSNNSGIETRLALKQQLKLCKRHFTADSFISGGDSLKLEAVPLLYLDVDKSQHLVLDMSTMIQNNPHCLIHNCGCIPSVDKVKLYPFPQEKEVLEKWLFNLQLPENYAPENAYICSRHFDKACIQRGLLHKSAVPTIFLGHSGGFYRNGDDIFNTPCAVPHCKYDLNEEDDGAHDVRLMYKFPKDSQRLKKWLDNIRITDDVYQKQKNRRICSEHFEEICKVAGKDTLLPHSVPTLNLGYNPAEVPHRNHHQNCCFDSCKLKDKYSSMTMHKLPQNEKMRALWLEELDSKDDAISKQFLCAAHFLAIYERVKEKHKVFVKQLNEYEALSNVYRDLKQSDLLQSFKCSIPQCSTGFKQTIKLFKFPMDGNLFNKWQHNTGLQFDMSQRSCHLMCALHFEPRCLCEVQLHRWAVPTLGLPTSNSLYVNPPEALPSDHENLQHCCVSSCSSTRGPFFQFPTKQINLKRWIHNLGLGTQQCTTNLRVCYKHFEKYCFMKREDQALTLKIWSIPTLKLPANQDLYKNPIDKVCYFSCSVPGCKQIRNSTEGIYFYCFPKNKTLERNWLLNTGIKPGNFREDMRICSLHFEPECFLKDSMQLRKHTVPTLKLRTANNLLHKNPIRKKLLIKNTTEKCLVKSCTYAGDTLYDLPKNISELKSLGRNLELEDVPLDQLERNLKICKKHYNEELLKRSDEMKAKPLTAATMDPESFATEHKEEEEENTNREANMENFTIEQVDLTSYEEQNLGKAAKTIRNLEDGVTVTTFIDPLSVKAEKLAERKVIQTKNLTHKYKQFNNDGAATTSPIKTELIKENNTLCRVVLKRKLSLSTETSLKVCKIETRMNPFKESPNALTNDSPSNLTQICCVKNCGSKQKDSPVQFTEFPKTIAIYKKWLQNLRIPHSPTVRHYYRVCWQHFETVCCGKNGLKIDSVPTLKLGHNNTDIHPCLDENLPNTSNLPHQGASMLMQTPALALAQPKPKYNIKKCSYPECKSNKTKLYDLPPFQKLCEKWWQSMQLYSEHDKSQAKVCDIHFYMLYHQHEDIVYAIKREQPGKYGELKELYASIAARGKVIRHRCIVPNCTTDYLINSSLDIKLYNFPSEYQLAQKWCSNCQIDYETCINGDRDHNYKVCALHFETYCVGNDLKLYNWAVPTLRLLHVDYNQLCTNNADDVFSTSGRCCIRDCINENGLKTNTRFYRLLDKWIHGIDAKLLNLNELRICGVHFSKRFFRKDKSLTAQATPYLQINPNNANLHHHTQDTRTTAAKEEAVEQVDDSTNAVVTVKQEIEYWDDWYNSQPIDRDESIVTPQYEIITIKEEIIDDTYTNDFQMNTSYVNTNDDNNNKDNNDKETRPQIVACYSQHLPIDETFIKQETDIDERDYKMEESIIPEPITFPYHNNDESEAMQENDHHTNRKSIVMPLEIIPTISTNELNENNANVKKSKTINETNAQSTELCEINSNQQLADTTIATVSSPLMSINSTLNQDVNFNKTTTTTTSYENRFHHIITTISLNTKNVADENHKTSTATSSIRVVAPAASNQSMINPVFKLHILTCCVASCLNSTQTPLIKLYTEFPSDSDLFIKWCFNLKIDPRHYREHLYAVCSAHFDSVCFKESNRSLQPWAVPTLNLGLPHNSFIHQYDMPHSLKATNEQQCIVWGCHQSQTPFYPFPADPQQSRKWFTNLQLEYTEFRAQTYRVCRKHFNNSLIDEHGQLDNEALPTLDLNHNNSDNNSVGCAQSHNVDSENFRAVRLAAALAPQDLEDHDSSYYEDFEECLQHNEQEN